MRVLGTYFCLCYSLFLRLTFLPVYFAHLPSSPRHVTYMSRAFESVVLPVILLHTFLMSTLLRFAPISIRPLASINSLVCTKRCRIIYDIYRVVPPPLA